MTLDVEALVARVRELEALVLELRDAITKAAADRDLWIKRTRGLLDAVAHNQVGKLLRLLIDRGYGALDREVQALVDELRPLVLG